MALGRVWGQLNFAWGQRPDRKTFGQRLHLSSRCKRSRWDQNAPFFLKSGLVELEIFSINIWQPKDHKIQWNRKDGRKWQTKKRDREFKQWRQFKDKGFIVVASGKIRHPPFLNYRNNRAEARTVNPKNKEAQHSQVVFLPRERKPWKQMISIASLYSALFF